MNKNGVNSEDIISISHSSAFVTNYEIEDHGKPYTGLIYSAMVVYQDDS